MKQTEPYVSQRATEAAQKRAMDKRPEYAAQMIPDEARITEAQSESLHNALIASCDEFVPPIHLPDEARIAAILQQEKPQ